MASFIPLCYILPIIGPCRFFQDSGFLKKCPPLVIKLGEKKKCGNINQRRNLSSGFGRLSALCGDFEHMQNRITNLHTGMQQRQTGQTGPILQRGGQIPPARDRWNGQRAKFFGQRISPQRYEFFWLSWHILDLAALTQLNADRLGLVYTGTILFRLGKKRCQENI